jgi:hypothetical protein
MEYKYDNINDDIIVCSEGVELYHTNINDIKVNIIKELEERYEEIIINHIISGRKLTYRTQINAVDGVYGQEFLTEYRTVRDDYRNKFHSKENIINSFDWDNSNINEKLEIIKIINEL